MTQVRFDFELNSSVMDRAKQRRLPTTDKLLYPLIIEDPMNQHPVVENLAPGVFEIDFVMMMMVVGVRLLALNMDQFMILHYRPLQVS